MQIHFKIWPKQIKVEGIHELWIPTLRHLGSHLQSVGHSTNILYVLTQASSCSINLNISCSSESSAFLHICHQEPKLGIQKYRSPLQTLVQKRAIGKKKLCGAAVGNFQTLSVTNLSLQFSSASVQTFQLLQKMEESWLQTLTINAESPWTGQQILTDTYGVVQVETITLCIRREANLHVGAADGKTVNHLALQVQRGSCNDLWSCSRGVFVTFKMLERINRNIVRDCPHDLIHWHSRVFKRHWALWCPTYTDDHYHHFCGKKAELMALPLC